MKKEIVFDGRGWAAKLNRIGGDIQKVNKVSVKLLELTGKTATVNQLLNIMQPGRLVERQQRAKGVFFELASVPGLDGDDPTISEFLTFLMSIPAGLQMLPASADGVEVLADGRLQMTEKLVDEIRAQFTHTLTEKQLKVKRWSERFAEVMSDPLANEIGFVGYKGYPITLTDKLKLNESTLCKIN
jgi:hypothetical protein